MSFKLRNPPTKPSDAVTLEYLVNNHFSKNDILTMDLSLLNVGSLPLNSLGRPTDLVDFN